jgi:electron transfer flavoprotein alpha subunit
MSVYPNLIMVSSDQAGLLKELVGKARQIADPLGWGVAVLPLQKNAALDAKDLGTAGADILYRLDSSMPLDGSPEESTTILAEAVRQFKPGLVLVGATKLGMEVAPRVAERLGLGYRAWAVDAAVDPATGLTTAQCLLYTGQGLATYKFTTPTTLLTAAQGVFKSQSSSSREVQEVALAVAPVAPRMKIVEYHPKGGGSSRIEEARAVVDVGQGIKQREDLALLESLAEWLDGQMACSRPVASDRDWFPEWLGLSGKKVSPELCLAVGISGAVQHIIGIRDSRVIVAVNNDENAGIFSQVDYGVVADLYAFLPVLLERLKARNVRPAWKL